MNDERTSMAKGAGESGSSPLARWGKGLETTKVGPLTVVIFIMALGVFSAAAAGIGYLTHHLPGRTAGTKPTSQPSEVGERKPSVP